MRINRFIGDFDFTQKTMHLTERSLLNQLRNVLRMREGNRIILSDGKGKEVLAEVAAIRKDGVEMRIVEEQTNLHEPDVHTILYSCILKKENFEWAVQKACEVGVREIVPLISERTVKTRIPEERLARIIREAAEQSERGFLPIIRKTLDFEEALLDAETNHLNLFFDRSGTPLAEIPLEEEIARSRKDARESAGERLKVACFIGPEGGWSPEEIRMVQNRKARNGKWRIVALSKLNLRAETAAIIAAYLACHSIG